MGSLMKDRILCVAIALSLVAVLFVAVPSTTEAAVDYTGEVQTTDDAGDPMDVYFQGDHVYVLVETYYHGNATNETFRVELQTQSGTTRDSFEDVTGEPETGVYESWAATPMATYLHTGYGFSGEIIVYDVVLFAYDSTYWYDWVEVDRTQIVVKNVGLFLDPDSNNYYPGQTVNLKVVTTETEDFYIQLVNDTFETFMNWTDKQVEEDDDWTLYETWIVGINEDGEPEDIPDGDYTLYVRNENTNAFFDLNSFSIDISINKYFLLVDCQSTYVLPGQTVSIVYDVVDAATMTHYTGAEIEWNAVWIDDGDDEVTDSGTLPSSSGTFQFTVADDIALYSDIDMMFWANESDERSAETGVYMTIGTLFADLDVSAGPYIPGDVVALNVDVMIGVDWDIWNNDEVSGAVVDLSVSKNGTDLPQYGIAGMVTDVTGQVDHEFVLEQNAEKGTYVVEMMVSYLDYEIESMATFEVEFNGGLVVEFSKDVYYSGQLATMTFKVIWNNEEINATSVYYILYGDYGLLATGNSTTGVATFPIPADYVGDIGVEAITVVNGYYLYGWAETTVHIADIALHPMTEEYRAGDTVTWAYELATSMTNGTIRYEIEDDVGVRVASDDLPFAKSGSFDFEVPEVDPATEYTATITVEDGLGHVVSDSASVWLVAEYELRIWIESGAGFTSRAFEAGATITFGFSVTAIGVADLDVYRVSFYATDEYIDGNVLVAGTTGTFEYTLDDNVNDGVYEMRAWLWNPVNGDLLSSDTAGFDVKTDQSLWDKSVGGLSLFDVTVLLLLLIMVILLVLVPMIKARMDAKPKEPAPMVMEQTPPPPAEDPPTS
ncbi:MAG TPA: hypothetical protein VMW71_05925 [Thermoplasmata archaeon]|nr:hypothetical protein [Thermoplasmata archaeon]